MELLAQPVQAMNMARVMAANTTIAPIKAYNLHALQSASFCRARLMILEKLGQR